MTGYFPQRFYFGPTNWFYTNHSEGVACYDDVHCEDHCCHDMDFGLPYCCSKYMGLVYLGLMIGGGLVIAVLVIGCYICMTKKERELQAAAKLEAAKAANHQSQQTSCDTSSSSYDTDQTSITIHAAELAMAPPTYSDAMATYSRCHSYDTTMMSQQALDLVTMFVRQHSQRDQGLHYSLAPLPPLVDVSALIAHHRLEHSQLQTGALPPVSSQNSIDDKLPSYEQCISGTVSRLSTGEMIYQGNNHGPAEQQNQQTSGSHVVDVEMNDEEFDTDTSKYIPHSDSQILDVEHIKNQMSTIGIKDSIPDDSHFIDIGLTVQQLRITEITGQAVLQATDDLVSDTDQQRNNQMIEPGTVQPRTHEVIEPATDHQKTEIVYSHSTHSLSGLYSDHQVINENTQTTDFNEQGCSLIDQNCSQPHNNNRVITKLNSLYG